MKNLRSALFLLTAGLALAPAARAQARYATGNTVANFTLTDRATGRPVQLTDFAGKVVLLEWFAWWCPFCQASASQIGPGIVQYYSSRGGNAAGFPVLHVSINLQGGQDTQTQQFVEAYRLGLVINDFDRALANRFQADGQPIFAVINGVTNSSSHRPWELVYSQLGYGSTQAPIAAMKSAIDSVRGAVVIDPLAIAAQPSAVTATLGSAVVFDVIATGTGPLTYQWFRDGVAIPGATTANYTLPAATTTVVGNYTVRITGSQGTVTSAPARLTVNAAPIGLTSRLSNLSLLTTLAANQVLTVGFTMQGGAKPVLLRAAGPGLATLGVTGTMADPRLNLFSGATQVGTNDNWAGNSAVAAANTALGAFPFASTTSLDAALVSSIDGGRTMQVSGPAAGTVIVEAYDAGTGETPRLTNLSAINQVGPGANVLTAGFTIAGTGTKTVLLRAVGPSLTPLGVAGALADPKLELYNSAREKIAENDTWAPALASAFASVGALALTPGGKDAALVVTLTPGGYTLQASPAKDGAGAVLVEVYEIP